MREAVGGAFLPSRPDYNKLAPDLSRESRSYPQRARAPGAPRGVTNPY